jgi:prepilin-type N-terminal cleavage/methylation domain-containing protein
MNKGFTLMEILIVICIVAILSLMVLSNLQNQLAKAHDSQRKTNVDKIQKALEEFYNDNKTYPSDATPLAECGSTSSTLSPYLQKMKHEFNSFSVSSKNSLRPDNESSLSLYCRNQWRKRRVCALCKITIFTGQGYYANRMRSHGGMRVAAGV